MHPVGTQASKTPEPQNMGFGTRGGLCRGNSLGGRVARRIAELKPNKHSRSPCRGQKKQEHTVGRKAKNNTNTKQPTPLHSTFRDTNLQKSASKEDSRRWVVSVCVCVEIEEAAGANAALYSIPPTRSCTKHTAQLLTAKAGLRTLGVVFCRLLVLCHVLFHGGKVLLQLGILFLRLRQGLLCAVQVTARLCQLRSFLCDLRRQQLLEGGLHCSIMHARLFLGSC